MKNTDQKTDSSHKGSIFIMIILGSAIMLVFGYFMVKDKDWFNNLFLGEEETEQVIDEAIISEEVSVLPYSIMLNKTELIFNRINAQEQLAATIFPHEVSEENKKIIWMSSNNAVAKVDTNGLVTAVANGHIVISAITTNGLSDICSVQVKINQSKVPATAQLNDLLNKISNHDDNATDRLRSVLGNSLRVEGATNISNVQQLIIDVSNGNRYRVIRVNTNADGKVISIIVNKRL